ncbi:aldo/keto reductase [Cronobacter turicensis]
MRVIAQTRAVSVSQIALAWLLARPAVTSVIIGVKRQEQLTDNRGASNITLTAEELARLDTVSTLPPHYPAWMDDCATGGPALPTTRGHPCRESLTRQALDARA